MGGIWGRVRLGENGCVCGMGMVFGVEIMGILLIESVTIFSGVIARFCHTFSTRNHYRTPQEY